MAIKRITTNLIEDGSIGTIDIANNAITAAKITDGNITTAKLADLNVTAGKLAGTLDLTGKTITVATATTGDSDTSPASTAFVQQEIAALVDSSPSSLNTLNELAAALGDDASFSTTVTNSIATKLPLAGGTMTGDLKVGATIASTGGTTNNRGILLAHQNNTNQSYVGRSENGVADTGNRITFDYDNDKMQLDSDGDIILTPTSNVGIGTTSPYKKLEVAGDIQLDATDANIWLKSGAGGTNGFINWTFNSDSTVYNKIGMDYDTRATTGFHIDAGYPITIDAVASNNKAINFAVSGNTKAMISGSGEVGILTTSLGTEATLHIGKPSGASNAEGGQLVLQSSTDGSLAPHLDAYTNASVDYLRVLKGNDTVSSAVHSVFDLTNTRLGIGETAPETSLHIKNSGNSFLTLERSGTTGGTGKFGINMEGGSSQQTTMSYDDGGKLVIGRSSDPATAAGFNNDFILKGGFVGIKTVDPQVELHVTGNANISGSTTVGGVITSNHIIRSDAGHNTSRVEAVYDDNSAQYDSNILMWVSEPGYTYDSGGIGVNVHESGHYYGRRYDNDYAVFMRFIKSDGSIQFGQNQGTSGTAGASQVETLKITANGTLRLATTGGIGFGTTAAADTLDDYEEGTWTPALGPGSGQSYGNRSGHYTKVGRMVTAYFGARLTAGTFTGGEATITGLPFAVHTTGSYQEPQFVIYTLGGAPTGQTNGLNNGAYLPGQVSFYLSGGESQGRGRKYSANADQVLDANEVFDSNSFIKGIVTYYTS